jgi:hypothetical protein
MSINHKDLFIDPNNFLSLEQDMLEDPLFRAIWSVIKTWDINVPEQYSGYMGAIGNHARAIYEAVEPYTRQYVAIDF